MKYIVNKITEIIKRNSPNTDNEAMIRIEGFENIVLYTEVAHKVSEEFAATDLSVDIKLARSKFESFYKAEKFSSYLQELEKNGWVASESITRYRNLHNSNLLILLGTEAEEDKGGLANCFCITEDTIATDLDGHYNQVFEYLSAFGKEEKHIIDSLYKDLFTYIPVDIMKLSDIADKWEGVIATIDDFIELFFEHLDEWKLPKRVGHLPTKKEITGKKNVLETEYKFITGNLFKKMNANQYEECKKKMEKYEEASLEYCSSWPDWAKQEIKSYQEFQNVIMEFARGENVEENRRKLLKTDFDIVTSVLEIKLDKDEPKKKSTNIKIKGAPLSVFTKALLYTLIDCNEDELSNIKFKIIQANLASVYSDIKEDDEKEQLVNAWKEICYYMNGIVDYIGKYAWKIQKNELKIVLDNQNIFDADEALNNVENGIIKAITTNNIISKIEFSVSCFKTGNLDDDKADFKHKFTWEFLNTSSWKMAFSDLIEGTKEIDKNEGFIPIVQLEEMRPLIFAKSEEEFFDLYDESELSFDFDLVKYLKNKQISNGTEYIDQFIKLGKAFSGFIEKVEKEGFFGCLKEKEQSDIVSLVSEYTKTGELLKKETLPENLKWILDAYIHAFNVEEDNELIEYERDAKCCIVPPWHPATLQRLFEQKNFFLKGCLEWWNKEDEKKGKTKTGVDNLINEIEHICMIQNTVDLYPSSGQHYFGAIASFGNYSVYARTDIQNTSRLKDLIHKEAVFDDDFNKNEIARMNDNAIMIYDIILDYIKAFQNEDNLNLVFINPGELQPIIAAVYNYIKKVRNEEADRKIDISLKILVKPENRGGRNYLTYWMNEFFSQDENVNIRTYLNEWRSEADLEKFLNGNNDIVFLMDLLTINDFLFIKDTRTHSKISQECLFPIVYKPTPVSESTVKRRIELSQPQFSASYMHTQIVRFRNNMENVPDRDYIAAREGYIDTKMQEMIYKLHAKAYWVVCIDSGMDGALLRMDKNHKDDYSIIGFSTGKGINGQYNITITSRKTILKSIEKKLESKLYQLFQWEEEKIKEAAKVCINEAGKLDGISLFSAVNRKDYKIHEFMAYVLTSLREKKKVSDKTMRILIHLDSYQHWFSDNETGSESRPDFLMLEVENSSDDILHLKASVIECKIAGENTADEHKKKAYKQVKHGIEVLKTIFDPTSKSIKRRYWYAQLYRALVFAQVTFGDNTNEFTELSIKLRAILDGKFDISWNGVVLGYWINMIGENEIQDSTEDSEISIYNIPQIVIQRLLLDTEESVEYVKMDSEVLESEEEKKKKIEEREEILKLELSNMQRKEYKKELKESKEKDSSGRLEGNVVVEQTKESSPEKKQEYERVLIGKDRLSNKVFWEFGNPQLSNRHMLITGTSGQGKTYSIQTMLYELSKYDISSVVFDYTEGFRTDQLEKPFVERMGDRIKQHIIYSVGVPINPFKTHEIEVAGIILQEKASDVAARIANIFKHVYGFGDQQFSAVFEAARKGMEKYGTEMNMEHFKEMLEAEKNNNKTAQSVLSKMAPFFYSIDFNESEDFDWGNILYAKEAELNIFQLTSIDREMQVIITELMLWDAWYYTKKTGNKNKPFVVVLDEAQNLSHKTSSPSAAILTEGRKFGWSAWFATQSLKVLADDEVVRLLQAANKLYFKPTDDEMNKMAKQLDMTDSSMWMEALKNLKKGQCIVVGDRIGMNGEFGKTKPTITTVASFEERD